MDGKVSAPQVIDQLAGRDGSPQAEQEVNQRARTFASRTSTGLPSSVQAASAPSTPKRTRSG